MFTAIPMDDIVMVLQDSKPSCWRASTCSEWWSTTSEQFWLSTNSDYIANDYEAQHSTVYATDSWTGRFYGRSSCGRYSRSNNDTGTTQNGVGSLNLYRECRKIEVKVLNQSCKHKLCLECIMKCTYYIPFNE